MRRPDFLFIGPDKTGSTWLYEMLRRHPEAYVPSVKDLYFFDRYYDRGLEWYLSFFSEAPPGTRAVGELSHDYLYSVEVAERIRRHLPDVRLVTSLRDPAERTFSHYLYLVRSGRTSLPFDEALDAFPDLVENSMYHRHLSTYLERFPREQLKVLWFRDLRRDPRRFARELFDFLGISFPEGLPYDERVLPASRPRSSALARLMKWGATRARDLGLETLVGRIKRHPLVLRTLYSPFSRGERPSLDRESREKLVARFRDDVRRLEELLEVDLSAWRNGPKTDRGPEALGARDHAGATDRPASVRKES